METKGLQMEVREKPVEYKSSDSSSDFVLSEQPCERKVVLLCKCSD